MMSKLTEIRAAVEAYNVRNENQSVSSADWQDAKDNLIRISSIALPDLLAIAEAAQALNAELLVSTSGVKYQAAKANLRAALAKVE